MTPSPSRILVVLVIIATFCETVSGQSPMACCFEGETGGCQNITAQECFVAGGVSLPGGLCPDLPNQTRACCLKDDQGSSICEDLDPCSCLNMGGMARSGSCSETCCKKTTGPYIPGPAPFNNVDHLCSDALRGSPLPQNLFPPKAPSSNEYYMKELSVFFRNRDYANSLLWLSDPGWRITGQYKGIPIAGESLTTHRAVRIYYSPEVVDFMCNCRRGVCDDGVSPCADNGDCMGGTCTIDLASCGRCLNDDGTPTDVIVMCNSDLNCGDDEHCGRVCSDTGLPCTNNGKSDCNPGASCGLFGQGAAVVKEIHTVSSIVVDETKHLCEVTQQIECAGNADCPLGEKCQTDFIWLNQDCYPDEPTQWTLMVQADGGSHDNWYWAWLKESDTVFKFGNPPVHDRSGVTSVDFFNNTQALIDHADTHYPTGAGVQVPRQCLDGTPCSMDADCGPLEICAETKIKQGSAVSSLYDYGRNGCLSCHGSAKGGGTFASLNNILDKAVRYRWFDVVPPDCPPLSGGFQVTAHEADLPQHTYANPLTAPNQAFLKRFPQFSANDPSIQDVVDSRLPAQTYDLNLTTGPGPNKEQFLTSNQCSGCHGAMSPTGLPPNMVVSPPFCKTNQDCQSAGCDATASCNPTTMQCEGCCTKIDLSPFAEWSASPMGLAGRDPIFLAQLESEVNRAKMSDGPTGCNTNSTCVSDCIENLCLHCHGMMGQWQSRIDNGGNLPETCRELYRVVPQNLPTIPDALQNNDLFTREYLNAWPDPNNPDPTVQARAKYGGLARDGISCAVCHHVTETKLGNQSTFTGNFNLDTDLHLENIVFGPYSINVETRPMQNSLGIKPVQGDQIRDSAMCGSCHAIYLPVIDDGSITYKFEQTTYLEWLNSEFAGEDAISCQACHMRGHYNGRNVQTAIANIEASPELADPPDSFPINPEMLADLNPIQRGCDPTISPFDCDTQEATKYGRHTLYGLNVFLNEIFQQFPLILGYRQLDPTSSTTRPALLTAREEVLKIARQETARVEVSQPDVLCDASLCVDVTVRTAGFSSDPLGPPVGVGHKFPSGVSFRRVFLEFVVLADDGEMLWASGRTNELGVILNGRSNTETLPTEFFDMVPGGCANNKTAPNGQCWQPHYQVIRHEDQVQIYEELYQNAGDAIDPNPSFTTSFLHRAKTDEFKDNRILPSGWKSDFVSPPELHLVDVPDATGPHGEARNDPDYPLNGSPAPGADSVRYEIQLSDHDAQRVSSIQATLYYQATPPYYLNQVFNSAVSDRKTDIERLYYITSRLNVDTIDSSNQKFIEKWKLEIASDTLLVPPIPQDACCTSDNTCLAVDDVSQCDANGGIAFHPNQSCNGEACGVCCDPQGGEEPCLDSEVRGSCSVISGRSFKPGEYCDNEPDPCAGDAPAISDWGMATLILLILVGLTIKFAMMRRRA